MSLQERVTPEELDAWLRTTVVMEAENEDYHHEPTSYEDEPNHPLKKREDELLRRRSSSGKDDISSRSCVGADAAVLYANEAQKDVQEGDNVFARLSPYFMLPSEGSKTVDNKHHFRGIQACHDDVLPSKKRRVSPPPPGELGCHHQNSHVAQPSYIVKEIPYCRLVTDDSVSLDREAQYSRRSSQYTQPFRAIGHDDGYSICSSLYTVLSDNVPDQGVHSFLRAMEVSQRSHDMLFDLKNSMLIRGSLEAMRESRMSRTLLFEMNRRTVVKNMSGASVNEVQCGSPSLGGKQYDQEIVAADLQRIVREEMLRSQQRQEFMRYRFGFLPID
ncbi:hypothetical protein ACHAW6_002102 [Cyclotella cf. meneghiniana]